MACRRWHSPMSSGSGKRRGSTDAAASASWLIGPRRIPIIATQSSFVLSDSLKFMLRNCSSPWDHFGNCADSQ